MLGDDIYNQFDYLGMCPARVGSVIVPRVSSEFVMSQINFAFVKNLDVEIIIINWDITELEWVTVWSGFGCCYWLTGGLAGWSWNGRWEGMLSSHINWLLQQYNPASLAFSAIINDSRLDTHTQQISDMWYSVRSANNNNFWLNYFISSFACFTPLPKRPCTNSTRKYYFSQVFGFVT